MNAIEAIFLITCLVVTVIAAVKLGVARANLRDSYNKTMKRRDKS